MMSRLRLSLGVYTLFLLAAGSVVRAQTDTALAQANDLLNKGNLQGAFDIYQSVLQSDARNVAALVGAARVHHSLNQPAKAVPLLEKAILVAPKDRTVAHNLGAVLYKTDNQPRALKVVREYLQGNATTPDEPLLNELLYMINNASEATKKTKLYTDAQAFVDTYTKTLEVQRPGFRRWGAQWLESKDVDEKLNQNKPLLRDVEKLDARIQQDTDALTKLEKQTPLLEQRVAKGWDYPEMLEMHRDAVRRARDERQRKIDDRDKVAARIARPDPIAEPMPIAFGTPAPELPKLEVAPPPPPKPVEPVQPQPGTRPRRTPRQPVQPVEPPIEVPVEPVPNGPLAPPEKPPQQKKISVYGVGFAISQDTLIVPSAVVADATEIVLQSPNGTSDEGTVIRSDPATGLALVKLKKMKAAALPLAATFDGGAVQCVALMEIGLFRSDAAVIDGKAAAPGEKWTANLGRNPKLPGAPLLSGGKVVGVTLASPDADAGAIPAITLDKLTKFIGSDTGTKGQVAGDAKSAIFQVVVSKMEK
jgi:S1-C subfamily serine protease